MGCTASAESVSASRQVIGTFRAVNARIESHAKLATTLDDESVKWLHAQITNAIDTTKRCKTTKQVLENECLNQALIAKNLLSRSFPDSFTSLKHLLLIAIELLELYVEVDHESIRDDLSKAAALHSTGDLQQRKGRFNAEALVLELPVVATSAESPSDDLLPPPPPLTREYRRPSATSPRNSSFSGSGSDSPQLLTLSGKITKRKQLSWDKNLETGAGRTVPGEERMSRAAGQQNDGADSDYGFFDISSPSPKSSPTIKASPSPSVSMRKTFFGDGLAPPPSVVDDDLEQAYRNAIANKSRTSSTSSSLGGTADVESDRSPTGVARGPAMA